MVKFSCNQQDLPWNAYSYGRNFFMFVINFLLTLSCFEQQVMVGCLIPAVTINVVSSYIDLFEKTQMEGSSNLSAATAIIICGASGLLFYIDKTVDLKTKQIKWTSSRGDTAEILGWCAGKFFFFYS